MTSKKGFISLDYDVQNTYDNTYSAKLYANGSVVYEEVLVAENMTAAIAQFEELFTQYLLSKKKPMRSEF